MNYQPRLDVQNLQVGIAFIEGIHIAFTTSFYLVNKKLFVTKATSNQALQSTSVKFHYKWKAKGFRV